MRFTILTVCPDVFDGFLKSPVIRRATESGKAQIDIVDIRGFAGGSFRHVDDSPFGGGAGMVMRCEPVLKALEYAKGAAQDAACADVTREAGHETKCEAFCLIALTPAGRTL